MTQWKRYPEAEDFLLENLERFSKINPDIAELGISLEQKTSTRLFDWIDHFSFNDAGLRKKFQALEWEISREGALHHPGATFPKISFEGDGVFISVDSIADFLMVRGMHAQIEGTPLSPYRRCQLSDHGGVKLSIVERRCGYTLKPVYHDGEYLSFYLQAKEKWSTRARGFEDEGIAMEEALALAKEMVSILGQDLAAWIVLECEREYWQRRNKAGQLQRARQDSLGMGWANHDHHTFRSSRVHFQKLVELFEILGFSCRERFYAGDEALWGAQVMENLRCNLVLFLDVDLLSDELAFDFSHTPFSEKKELGTIGLWCALHGDSILNAGMHHLEAQFTFEQLRDDLESEGIGMMEPFSNFPYLKQAFTKGERWSVASHKIEKLLTEGRITLDEAQEFRCQGAIGSHLENLQRRSGYKGFNQKNVSFIIQRTDPRLLKS